jgi:hypothetical protein
MFKTLNKKTKILLIIFSLLTGIYLINTISFLPIIIIGTFFLNLFNILINIVNKNYKLLLFSILVIILNYFYYNIRFDKYVMADQNQTINYFESQGILYFGTILTLISISNFIYNIYILNKDN